jgi:hypothetical protein
MIFFTTMTGYLNVLSFHPLGIRFADSQLNNSSDPMEACVGVDEEGRQIVLDRPQAA